MRPSPAPAQMLPSRSSDGRTRERPRHPRLLELRRLVGSIDVHPPQALAHRDPEASLVIKQQAVPAAARRRERRWRTGAEAAHPHERRHPHVSLAVLAEGAERRRDVGERVDAHEVTRPGALRGERNLMPAYTPPARSTKRLSMRRSPTSSGMPAGVRRRPSASTGQTVVPAQHPALCVVGNRRHDRTRQPLLLGGSHRPGRSEHRHATEVQ